MGINQIGFWIVTLAQKYNKYLIKKESLSTIFDSTDPSPRSNKKKEFKKKKRDWYQNDFLETHGPKHRAPGERH